MRPFFAALTARGRPFLAARNQDLVVDTTFKRNNIVEMRTDLELAHHSLLRAFHNPQDPALDARGGFGIAGRTAAKVGTRPDHLDFHAVSGPGGGMYASQAGPGQNTTFSFKALVPGLLLYHCGTPDVSVHIANGMFGMILVQPDVSLPPVDEEFYVMQSELYTIWPIHTTGNQIFDGQKLLAMTPTYFVFNGAFKGLTGAHQLTAQVNQTIRIYFVDAGPDFISSFHIIGEIFNRVWQYGDLSDPPLHGVQTVLVPPGGCVVVDLTLVYPANYVLVDHAIYHAVDMGAMGILHVTGPTNSTIFKAGA